MWIAFKNYYLRDEGQHRTIWTIFKTCCELLSKIIIFVMKDNARQMNSFGVDVVNCFQKLLSSWWRTTQIQKVHKRSWLWIAFKNYYLRDEGQRSTLRIIAKVSCELLSKIIIFVMKDNICLSVNWNGLVVNCFQKLLSSWWRTTFLLKCFQLFLLWIAFKNYYLRDEGQQWVRIHPRKERCELLSKIIIFVMKDN